MFKKYSQEEKKLVEQANISHFDFRISEQT